MQRLNYLTETLTPTPPTQGYMEDYIALQAQDITKKTKKCIVYLLFFFQSLLSSLHLHNGIILIIPAKAAIKLSSEAIPTNSNLYENIACKVPNF